MTAKVFYFFISVEFHVTAERYFIFACVEIFVENISVEIFFGAVKKYFKEQQLIILSEENFAGRLK